MKKIAIIGSGISGLSAAYLLSTDHEVTVFEKDSRLGGHTATMDVNFDGDQLAVDTGFIVFNNRTYPRFLALLDKIGMGRQPTEMSFSVQNKQTGLEYNGHNLSTLFAQRRNLLSPGFWQLIRDILRFNKRCKQLYASDNIADITLGQFLRQEGFSRNFCEHYILPMGAAIWSSSLAETEEFGLPFFIRFFENHGLLDIKNRPQWYVIPGGSRAYIEPLTAAFKQNIKLNSCIKKVERGSDGVTLTMTDGQQEQFDELVFACHSDQALMLLGDNATEAERDILGAIPYSANSVVLHTDISLLPKKRKAWAAWNYQLLADRQRPSSVTYNMNILQGIDSRHTYCVTLNQDDSIDDSKIIQKFVYHHPVFNTSSLAAQQRRAEICGQNHTHYVGAYWYNGFHEDGVHSACDIAERFDSSIRLDSTGAGSS
ncbi:MAG: FAD-dependent oxidoreductase [Pseudohongiella nitratireducens]|nr:FAD-dependent oxidoreductase [Pseudohongiella nitratireducens]